MDGFPSRLAFLLGLVLAGTVSAGGRLEAGAPESAGAGLSGTWSLKEDSGGISRGAVDAPLEAVGDAHRLAIVDDGAKLEITYPTGRKRFLYTDGMERELDDGGGPAKVTARRKGPRGEKVLVTSEWPDETTLKETWELQARPLRLVVEGAVKGRHPLAYRRVYEPSLEPAPAPAATPSRPEAAPPPPGMPPAISPATPPASAPVPATTRTPVAPAAASGARPPCSLRPPRGTSPRGLAAMAKITAAEAERRAVASVAPLRVSSVIFSDLEVNEGCLVWPLDLRLEGKAGVQEILIDAGDGKVLASNFEPTDRPETPRRRP